MSFFCPRASKKMELRKALMASLIFTVIFVGMGLGLFMCFAGPGPREVNGVMVDDIPNYCNVIGPLLPDDGGATLALMILIAGLSTHLLVA